MEEEGKKISKDQKEILLGFMEDNLDFARGRLQVAQGRTTFKNLWMILVEQLNSFGKQKTMQQWQRTWTDIKIKVRRKVSAMKASRMKTGGGPMTDILLSDFDDRVIKIISEESVFGIQETEGVDLESEQRRTETDESELLLVGPSETAIKRKVAPSRFSSAYNPEPSGLVSKKTKWNQCVDLEEATVRMTKNSGSSTQSSGTDDDTGIEETTSTPRKISRVSAATKAAQDLKSLSGETNKNIERLTDEVAKLNNKMDTIIEQNNASTRQKEETNILLERIARALEGQTP